MLAPDVARSFDFEDVAARAEAQARQPHRAVTRKPPPELAALTYDQYPRYSFSPRARTVAERGLAVRADVLSSRQVPDRACAHQRGHAARTCGTFAIAASISTTATTSCRREAGATSASRAFARTIRSTSGGYKDELAVFLGASYFRALGAGQRYGLSARGLAIDTIGGQREEFPRFSEFWIVRPAADATKLTLYALLDSPRASGAYQFDIEPGKTTTMDVRARLYLRAEVATLGIAPLTSMYLFGENPAASH